MKIAIVTFILSLLPCMSYCMENNAFVSPAHLGHIRPTLTHENEMDFTEYHSYLHDRVEPFSLDECKIVMYDPVYNIYRYTTSPVLVIATTSATYEPQEDIVIFENNYVPSSVEQKKEYFLFCPRCNKRFNSTHDKRHVKYRICKHLVRSCKNKISANEQVYYQNIIQTQLDQKYPTIKD